MDKLMDHCFFRLCEAEILQIGIYYGEGDSVNGFDPLLERFHGKKTFR